MTTDHVIAATGSDVDMNRLEFLAPDILAALTLSGRAPELCAHLESAVPGLYLLGQASAQTFGPAMRFIYCTRFVAPQVTKHLLRTIKLPLGNTAAPRPSSWLDPRQAWRLTTNTAAETPLLQPF